MAGALIRREGHRQLWLLLLALGLAVVLILVAGDTRALVAAMASVGAADETGGADGEGAR